MPFNSETKLFERAWRFVDRFLPGDLAKRAEVDAALGDVEDGINATSVYLKGLVDAAQVQSLLIGALPAAPTQTGTGAALVAGNLYLKLPDLVLYAWDGTEWKKQGDLPAASAFFKSLAALQDDVALRDALGLGTAALADADAFATKAQGDKADRALTAPNSVYSATLETIEGPLIRQIGSAATATGTPPFALAVGDILLNVANFAETYAAQLLFRPSLTEPRIAYRTQMGDGAMGAWVEVLTGPVIKGGIVGEIRDDGTLTSGTYTPAPFKAGSPGNWRKITNGGAFTFAAPSETQPVSMVITVTNGAAAGTVTFSGFAKVYGDALTTTSGHKFIVHITKSDGAAVAVITAAQ